MNKIIKYEIDPFRDTVLNELERKQLLEQSLHDFISKIDGQITAMSFSRYLMEVPYSGYFIVRDTK